MTIVPLALSATPSKNKLGLRVVNVAKVAMTIWCLLLVGVERDDEVVIPALTFVATANAVAYCGAHSHFVDSSWKTLGICPDKLEEHLAETLEMKSDGFSWNRQTGRRVSACVPMHTFGHAVDMDAVAGVCAGHNIAAIEDAAEGLGSRYKDNHVGNIGLVAALSFNGNKIVTTGGGGAILTSDDELAARAKHLTTTAKTPHPWECYHDEVGYNYRMPNINAALGCAQIEQLDGVLAKKRRLAEAYQEQFSEVDGCRVFVEPELCRSNYWLNCLVLDKVHEIQRDEVLESLNSRGIMARPAWTLMPDLPMGRMLPSASCDDAREMVSRIINLPSGIGACDLFDGERGADTVDHA